MTLLIPLGLLGLLSIAVLILIYIIRPNYQQKFVSSTYVWKLSLQLKKRTIPISKLRNLLLILFQILFLVSCALALAQPVFQTKAIVTEREVVTIIDSSASMRAGLDGQTRFGRAVGDVEALTDQVFDGNGIVTVILAGETPSVLAQRATADSRSVVEQALSSLEAESACSYGTSDIDAAMSLCEEIVSDNAKAEIFLYTDTTYSYVPSSVTLVDVREDGEWNAGILNAYTALENNYYTLYVEVACYGVNDTIDLNVQINGANFSDTVSGHNISVVKSVTCNDDQTKTIIFRDSSQGTQDYEQNAQNTEVVLLEHDTEAFYSYEDIQLWVDVDDAFVEDNSFAIYDGSREKLNVLYASSLPNLFIPSMIRSIGNQYTRDNTWDIRLTQLDTSGNSGMDAYYEEYSSGYDLYIFEHTMPDSVPTDGVVVLLDPDKGPKGSGIVMESGVKTYSTGEIYLFQEDDDVLLNGVTAGNISLTQFRPFTSFDDSYKVLLSADDDPVLIAKNEGDSKIIAMNFSVHYSNLALQFVSFTYFFYNLFENYIPATVVGNSFEVYESISLQSRGDSLMVTGPGIDGNITFTEFPASLNLSSPGTYTLYQQSVFGKEEYKDIFVTIPSYECNIWRQEDSFRNPYLAELNEDYYDDLILYVASAMVALLFIEWLLQARENL